MTASEIYDRYLLKVEKNSTNDNISTDKKRFVEIYNEFQIRYLEYVYSTKNEEDSRYIESLLIKNKNLQKIGRNDNYSSFKLPVDYFNFSSVYAIGSKGNCRGKKIDLPIEVLDSEVTNYLIDAYVKPSFEYRESFYNFSGNNINIYFTDFDIDSAILSYYRYPNNLKLENPDNPESDFDDTVTIDFDEKSINKIISAAASGFDINNNSERWQLHNVFSKKDL